MSITPVDSFAAIEQAFVERVQALVWCNLATLDAKNRLRSRIVHPLWEGQVGWITTRRTSPKAKHLAHHPYISLAYIADLAKPVYADCTAEWADDLETKQHVWELCRTLPPPVGFDPAPIYGSVDSPGFGVIKLTPWRIEVDTMPTERLVWVSKRGMMSEEP